MSPGSTIPPGDPAPSGDAVWCWCSASACTWADWRVVVPSTCEKCRSIFTVKFVEG